jgi:hypothetical protein
VPRNSTKEKQSLEILLPNPFSNESYETPIVSFEEKNEMEFVW